MRRPGRRGVLTIFASLLFVVLLVPLASIASACDYCKGASLVLGQSGFTSSTAATSATGENGPVAVAFDSQGDLWVAESHNNRVIEYTAPYTTGEGASLVLGQPSFTTNASATSDTGLYLPVGLAFDAYGDLWVADMGNNRILEYPAPLSSGEAASIVLGQPNFGSSVCVLSDTGDCSPVGLAFDSHGNLWVADYGYNRILEYSYPFSTGQAASLVLGQAAFTTDAWGASTVGENGPSALAFDAHGDLWVVDNSNRVVEYMAPFSTSEAASMVLGQVNFTGSGFSTSATGEYLPEGLAFDQQGNLWVADFGNNRVIGYEAPFINGEAASMILGQYGFTSRGFATSKVGENGPSGIAFDSHGDLWVADYVNNRVLEYKDVVPPVITLSCAPYTFALGLTSDCEVTLKGFNGTLTGETVSIEQTGGTGSAVSLGTCTLTSAGKCTASVIGTMKGHVTLTVSYAGDSDNAEGSATTSIIIYGWVPPHPPSTPC